MYTKIINPKTNRKVSIYSRLGKKILNSYINQVAGAASICTEFHGKPLKCNSYSKDGISCVYSAAKVKGEIGQCRKSQSRNLEKSRESARRRAAIEKQFQKSSLTLLKKGLSKKKMKDNLKKIKNCKECAAKINGLKLWNDNNCDECIELEDRLHFFSSSDDNYFRFRQEELETFENEIMPNLNKIFVGNNDAINSFLEKNYFYNDINNYTDYLETIKDGFNRFYKIYKKLYNQYNNIKVLLPRHINVTYSLEQERFYFYNIDTNEASYSYRDVM